MPCLIFLREAEHDKSRMVSSLCMRRNMINHAPTIDMNKFNKRAVLTRHTADIAGALPFSY